MTIIRRLDKEIVLFLVAAAILSTFIVWRNHNNSQNFRLNTPIIAGDAYTAPVVTDPILRVDTVTQPSPDGSVNIEMITTHNQDGTLLSIIKTIEQSTKDEHTILTASGSATEQLTIPFNAWSPDNKYVFIQKSDNNALVFSATGEEIITGEKYIDVKEIFAASGKEDTYELTTGWASPTLLIVNTRTSDNKKGGSYWFEVPSKAIIQLSSEF